MTARTTKASLWKVTERGQLGHFSTKALSYFLNPVLALPQERSWLEDAAWSLLCWGVLIGSNYSIALAGDVSHGVSRDGWIGNRLLSNGETLDGTGVGVGTKVDAEVEIGVDHTTATLTFYHFQQVPDPLHPGKWQKGPGVRHSIITLVGESNASVWLCWSHEHSQLRALKLVRHPSMSNFSRRNREQDALEAMRDCDKSIRLVDEPFILEVEAAPQRHKRRKVDVEMDPNADADADAHTYHALLLEYAAGGCVRRRVKEMGPAKEEEARVCFRRICEAVNHLHSKQFMYRDLKPDNVLICDEGGYGSACLADFDTAIRVPRLYTRRSYSPVGSPGFTSPIVMDQIRSGSDVAFYDASVDVWGLGALLYFLLTGCDLSSGYNIPGEWPKNLQDLVNSLLATPPTISTIDEILSHPWVSEQ